MNSRTCLMAFVILANLCIFVSLPNYWCPEEKGNYTTNSTYHTNLNNLLSSLASNMGDSGFYSASLGQGPDRVNAIAFCRGDAQLDDCRSCVQKSAADTVTYCTNRKEASIWNIPCMVRYSNDTIYGKLQDSRAFKLSKTGNTSNPEEFHINMWIMFEKLLSEAASGWPVKIAQGSKSLTRDFVTTYALLQCTPDLSEQDCRNCLVSLATSIPKCCSGALGLYLVAPSCYIRYEAYLFYNKTRVQEAERLMATAPTPEPQLSGKEDNSMARTVAIIVPIMSALILVVGLGIWLRKRTKKKLEETFEYNNDEIKTADSLRYKFNEIREATHNFAITNKLGTGGFGVVYKGKLKNGQEIAAKRLYWGSGQGDSEFRNEVMLLAKLQHRNLVRLVGFAEEGTERVLIYEFIQNGSLDNFIFDPAKAHFIDCHTRLKVIEDIAKGLLYLHADSRMRVIHRDLKPSNILLDVDMNPKIADFGMARLYEHNESEVNASRIVGTYGYMAPEYVIHGQFSIKSDVFSYGVLVLEIISGQRNNNFHYGEMDVNESLLNFAWRNWQEGTITNVFDPILRSSPDCFREIIQCAHIALLCIQENASDRPTMCSVVHMLSSFTVTLPIPSKPAFFGAHTLGLTHRMDPRDMESFKSKNDFSVTQLQPR